MKSIILCAAIGCRLVGVAATNEQAKLSSLVSEMPIEYVATEFRFYKNVTEVGKAKEAIEKEKEAKEKAKTEIKDIEKKGFSRESSVSSHTQINTMAVMGGGFAASSQTQIDFNNKIAYSSSSERSSLNENEREQLEKVQKIFTEEVEQFSGNWMFTVIGHFANKQGAKYSHKAGVPAKIYVGIPGAEIEMTTTNAFDVVPNAKKTVEFTREIVEDDYKAMLWWYKVADKLNSRYCRARIEADFPLVDTNQVSAFHSADTDPIIVDVRFGAYKRNFPLRVQRVGAGAKELTVGDALKAVSAFFCEKLSGDFSTPDRVFKIDMNKSLESVFGKKIGELDGDKMILMRQGGRWNATVGNNALTVIPNCAEVNKSIVFDQIGVYDIYYHHEDFSKDVKESFIRQLEALKSDKPEILVEIGLLYASLGDDKKKIEYLAKAALGGYDLSDKKSSDGLPLFWDMILYGTDSDVANLLKNQQKLRECANDELDGDKHTILSIVISRDDVAKYKALKDAGVNKVDNDGTKHLFRAAACGSLKIAKWIVEEAYYKEDVNETDKDEKSPLIHAAVNGHLDFCKWLVDLGADVEYKVNDEKDFLCDESLNPNQTTRAYIDAMRIMKKAQSSWFGEPDYTEEMIRQKLLPAGVDVDYRWNFKKHDTWHYSDRGWTFLRWAVVENKPKLVQYLVEKGAKIDATYHKHRGMLPMEWAINEGMTDVAKALASKQKIDLTLTKSKDGLSLAELLIEKIGDAHTLEFFLGSVPDAAKRKSLFVFSAKNGKLNALKVLAPCDGREKESWAEEALKGQVDKNAVQWLKDCKLK